MMRAVSIASVVAPAAVPGIAWILVKVGLFVLPPNMEAQTFIGVGIILCLFALPAFVLIARYRRAPMALFPVAGALIPLPVTFIVIMMFGALADDVEMSQRMHFLWTVAVAGALAGTAVAAAAWHERVTFNSAL